MILCPGVFYSYEVTTIGNVNSTYYPHGCCFSDYARTNLDHSICLSLLDSLFKGVPYYNEAQGPLGDFGQFGRKTDSARKAAPGI